MELRTQGSRPRPQKKKKKIGDEGQGPTLREQTLLRPRTEMLEAKYQERNAQVFSK